MPRLLDVVKSVLLSSELLGYFFWFAVSKSLRIEVPHTGLARSTTDQSATLLKCELFHIFVLITLMSFISCLSCLTAC